MSYTPIEVLYCSNCLNSNTYSKIFGMKRMLSSELKNKETLKMYYDLGFRYIRRYKQKDFNKILRNPSLGCYVEIFYSPQIDTEYIYSSKGYKIINKLCYF